MAAHASPHFSCDLTQSIALFFFFSFLSNLPLNDPSFLMIIKSVFHEFCMYIAEIMRRFEESRLATRRMRIHGTQLRGFGSDGWFGSWTDRVEYSKTVMKEDLQFLF